MRKKHGHSTRFGETTTLSEETLINIGHYHYATERYAVRLAQNEGSPDSVAQISRRLSELLADTAVRALSGDPSLLPHMWQNGFAADQRGRHPLRHVDQSTQELSDRSSGTRTLSKKARKAISKAQHDRWAKYHREKKRVKGSEEYEAQRAAFKDRRGSPEARAKQQKAMQKHYRDPVWRKAMLKRVAAMRARKKGMPRRPMSEETKAKLRAARFATLAKKRGNAA